LQAARVNRVRWAFVLYLLIAVALLGIGVVGHPSSRTFGSEDFDFSQFVWFVEWWPDALGAGRDPLHTTFLFAPGGYNLAWAATVPALSLAASPVTLLAGPVVAYNLLALAAPVLSSCCAFLLCRYVTGQWAASVAGGAAFGFSPYVIGNEQASALNLMYAALIPLAVWLVLRRLHGQMGARWFVVAFALVLVGQFLISAEVLATFTLFGALVLLGVQLARARMRPRLRALGFELLGAYALCAAAVSPFLDAMFARPHFSPAIGSSASYSSDLLSLVIPSAPLVGAGAFRSLTDQFPGGPLTAQRGFAYLGLPLLLIVALALFPRLRRVTSDPRLRLVGAAGAALALASLGPELQVAGHSVLPLPWRVFDGAPLLRYALPTRLAMFTQLCAALILSIWLSARPSRLRWALAGAALLFLLPDPGAFGRKLWEPSVYRDGRIARVLHPDDIVFAIPPYGESMRWQAETGMAYRLAGGYAAVAFPIDYLRLYCRLSQGRLTPAAFERFLREHRVTAILSPARYDRYLRRLDPKARAPIAVGDQTIIRMPRPARPVRAATATRGGPLSSCASSVR
jgi:hypothetical protein